MANLIKINTLEGEKLLINVNQIVEVQRIIEDEDLKSIIVLQSGKRIHVNEDIDTILSRANG
ncbi:Uncharacterised protein [Sphingobacterium spiritivorum]|uniref:Flagellar protein (FlbD) n=1 Tax=Sphingobacterium spiritivorum TaxID=258 RepID=A0A380CEP6_SPHSI|nr:hypothetical protein [Sphingobacterium spiritivorum]SUJ19102.1 Uncharacterised protein [Sphingobacterium spiritivorum]